jgi:DNA-binding transcriptional MerR regulator
MPINLLKSGDFAKIASTTKRTIHFYNQAGILKPATINNSGYRQYDQRQVLDYQLILLLTTFGLKIRDIKKYLEKGDSLLTLFEKEKTNIKREFEKNQFLLRSIERITNNIKANGTMVDPEIIDFKPLEIFFFDISGSYADIYKYCSRLYNMFEKPGSNFITLAIFLDQGYRPNKCRMKIGAIKNPGMTVKKQFIDTLKTMTLNPGKVIYYKYQGSGSLLSLFWKELEKYCRLKNIKIRTDIADFEIYRKVSSDFTKQNFEIYMPITYK